MSDFNSQFTPVMEELGIDPNSLDASDLEPGTEEVTTEEVTTEEDGEEVEDEGEEDEGEEGESVEESAPEGEEEAPKEESASSEEVAEEKTAKEIQEIEAEKAAFEAEKKSFQEERAKIESEFVAQYAEKLKERDEFDSFLSDVADRDPELFGLIQEEFKAFTKANHDPRLEHLKREQEETKKALNEIKARFSDEATRLKFDTEMTNLKSTVGKEAEGLGLKLDYKAVEEVWKNNPKLSLEEAFHAKYGASIAKAAASKAKVTAVENKVKSRPVVSTAGTLQRPNSKSAPHVPSDAFDAVRHFARELAGKK